MNFIIKHFGMKGFKTWIAVIGLTGLGVYEITQGNIAGGIERIIAALAMVGIGHKVEKSNGNK